MLIIMSLTAFVFLNTRHFEMKASKMPNLPEMSLQKTGTPESFQPTKNIGSGELLQDAVKLIHDLLEASLDFNATAKAEKFKEQSLDSNS